jgi:hypothetical protein
MNEPNITTSSGDLQASHGRTSKHCFVAADRHIAMAVNLIEEGRSNSATGAMKTCGLMLDLLAGVRTPLRRLGSIEQEAAFIGAPSFERESNEVSR